MFWSLRLVKNNLPQRWYFECYSLIDLDVYYSREYKKPRSKISTPTRHHHDRLQPSTGLPYRVSYCSVCFTITLSSYSTWWKGQRFEDWRPGHRSQITPSRRNPIGSSQGSSEYIPLLNPLSASGYWLVSNLYYVCLIHQSSSSTRFIFISMIFFHF